MIYTPGDVEEAIKRGMRWALDHRKEVELYTREEVLAAVEGAFEDVHGQGSQLGLGLLLEAVQKRLGARFVTEVEENKILITAGLLARVWDTKDRFHVAWCPNLAVARELADMLNRESEKVC